MAWRRIAAACIALSALGSGTAHAQVRRGLFIGINTYHYEHNPRLVQAWRDALARTSPEALTPTASRGSDGGGSADVSTEPRGAMPNLDGAVDDAIAMQSLLRSRYQFTDTRLLLDSQATRAGIIAAIQRLVADARPGDVVVFYYAGHGSERANSELPASIATTKYDQTIVPADANVGQYDLRNVELTQLFEPLLAKGVHLTLIFDSCNSGSAVRGLTVPLKARFAPYDTRDARDPAAPQSLVDPGRTNPAVFLAAAQEHESAFEDPQTKHGAFTAALIRVLRAAPIDEPAAVVYRQVRADMAWSGTPQNPVIKGVDRTLSRPLFGQPTSQNPGSLVMALLGVRGDTAVFDGGQALGVGPGTALHIEEGTGSHAGPVHLRVVQVGMASSVALVMRGAHGLAGLRPGVLAIVDTLRPTQNSVVLWSPPGVSAGQLHDLMTTASSLHGTPQWDLISDPTTIPDDGRPLYVARYDSGWHLVTPAGAMYPLSELNSDAIGAAVQKDAPKRTLLEGVAPGTATRPRIVVELPPPTSLVEALTTNGGQQYNWSTTPAAADYELIGRNNAGTVSYALVRPNATLASQAHSPLPARTDWLPAATSGGFTTVADSLISYADRLARILYWMTVTAPSAQPFPYTLALQSLDDAAHSVHEATDTTPVFGGQRYQVLLRRTSSSADAVEPRWLYVFTISSDGTGTLLFGHSANQIPSPDPNGHVTAPPEIVLPRSGFRVCPAYGVDTYFLIASDQPIPNADALFNFAPVRTRGTRAGLSDELTAQWSIQRMSVLSLAPPAGDAGLAANLAKCSQ